MRVDKVVGQILRVDEWARKLRCERMLICQKLVKLRGVGREGRKGRSAKGQLERKKEGEEGEGG